MEYKKILIGVDSSEYSLNAVMKGFDLAQQLKAQAALVFVVDTAKAVVSVDSGITRDQVLTVLKKEAQATLDQFTHMYEGFEFLKFMPSGHPRDEVQTTAEAWGADLIIIGTHGRTGFAHFILGSTAEYIVRHSKLPVMVVPFK